MFNASSALTETLYGPIMSAPDFYFAVNATARHIHDQYGMDVLVDYWRSLGREYYAQRRRNGATEALRQ